MEHNLLSDLPPPQRLALSYAPAGARRATLALLALDARLGALVRRRGEPVLTQMRLAWWRDTLTAAPPSWPAGDAVLDSLREWRAPAGLVALVDGWESLLSASLDAPAFAQGRGAAFVQLAAELGLAATVAAACGQTWALGDLAANLSDAAERAAVIEVAAAMPTPPALPRALRPLTVLAGLARRSLARGGGPLLDGPGALLLAIRLGIAGR